MKQQSFEDKVKDLVYHHEEAAPNVMDKVFEKRTPWYVLRNKLSLYKYRIAAAVLLIAGAFMLFNPFGGNQTSDEGNNVPLVAEQHIESTTKPTNQAQQGEQILHNSETNKAIAENTIEDTDVNDNAGSADVNVSASTPVAPSQAIDDDRTVGPSIARPEGTTTTPNTVVVNDDADKANPSEGSVEPSSDDGTEKSTTDGVAQNDSKEAEDVQTPDDQAQTPSVEDKNMEVQDSDIAQGDEPGTTSGDESLNEDEDRLGAEPTVPMRKWSVAMSYGPSAGNRRFDNIGDAGLINARNDSEKALYSNTAELTLNYAISPNIDVYLGLNYFNRRERMNYVQTTTTSSTDIKSREVVEYHPVLGPRTITVYDTVTKHVTVENNITSRNNYNHYIVPLGFRYTLYVNKNLGIFINGNAGLEFMTRANGQVLGANNELTNLSNFGRNRFGASLSGGAGVALRMNDRMTAMFEPRATFYLSPTNNLDYALNQWDQGYGFMIGLKYGL